MRPSLAACALALAAACDPPPSAAPPADYVEKIRGSDATFEMVYVPAGNFWIGKTEVTWDEYLEYCDFDLAERAPPNADAVAKPSRPLEQEPFDRTWGKGRRPAVGMSWNAAQKYCQWLSINTGKTYRLPTEAEWEQACAAEGQTPVADYAWTQENAGEMTQEVGRKKANRFGLHDMLGNLWEYGRDPFSPDKPDIAVLRGGSWKEPAAEAGPKARLKFDKDWTLRDPNDPPGQWWIPEGDHLGMRVLRPGPAK
jgi:formylglycine-generating enzyme required for sulfatase activity